MANLKVKVKKSFPHYGEIVKTGTEVLVDVDKIPRLVKKGWIEDPRIKSSKDGGK